MLWFPITFAFLHKTYWRRSVAEFRILILYLFFFFCCPATKRRDSSRASSCSASAASSLWGVKRKTVLVLAEGLFQGGSSPSPPPSEPGWRPGRRGRPGSSGGGAGRGRTWRGLGHGGRSAGGRHGAGPSGRRLCAGDGVGDQRSHLGGGGSRRGRRVRVLRAGRGPVVPGGLAVFDPLEINAATLPERDKRDKG